MKLREIKNEPENRVLYFILCKSYKIIISYNIYNVDPV